MRILITLAMLLVVASCASTNNNAQIEYVDQPDRIPAGTILAVQTTTKNPVLFRGQVSYDEAGLGAGQGALMYPGYSVASFAAALAVHAAVNDAVNDREKRNLQKKADKVLEPYTEVIGEMRAAGLVAAALAEMGSGNASFDMWTAESGQDWVLESKPLFLMSSNQSTLILKNRVSVYAPGNEHKPAYQNQLTVVSAPSDGTPIAIKSLRQLSVSLLADSFAMVGADLGDTATEGEAKTLQYYSGGERVFERGRVIRRGCNRVTFRTLRGWLKSVPTVKNDAPTDCPEGSEASVPSAV